MSGQVDPIIDPETGQEYHRGPNGWSTNNKPVPPELSSYLEAAYQNRGVIDSGTDAWLQTKATNGIGNALVKEAPSLESLYQSKGVASGMSDLSAKYVAGGQQGIANEAVGTSMNGGTFTAAEGAAAIPGAQSGWAMNGVGSAGNYIAPAAGLAGLYDLSQNRERIGTRNGYMQGAASGAAMGSYFGPWGTAIGAGIGLAGNALGIGHQSRTKGEETMRKQLAEQGVMVPNLDVKEWENNEKFRASRNEADLVGKDIRNAANLYAIKGYAQADASTQEAIAQEALNRKKVREHHGQIDIGMDAEFQKYLDSQLNEPVASTNSGDNKRAREQDAANNKKQRKRENLQAIMPTINAEVTRAPDYSIDLNSAFKNRYL
jgi:hypothetical protein